MLTHDRNCRSSSRTWFLKSWQAFTALLKSTSAEWKLEGKPPPEGQFRFVGFGWEMYACVGVWAGGQIEVGIHLLHTKYMDRQLVNVRQEYELKINVSSYIKHALK